MKKICTFWQRLRRNSPIAEDYIKLFIGMIILVIILILLYFITNIGSALAEPRIDAFAAEPSAMNLASGSISPASSAASKSNPSPINEENVQIVKRFANWTLLVEKFPAITTRCHIVARPTYTKLFSGVRYDPYLMLSYIPENKFTYGVFVGFDISLERNPVFILQDYQYPLASYRKSFAYTYDAFEDMAITNSIVKGLDYIRVKSYNRKKQVAMDYYSTKNLLEAMNFTRSYCREELGTSDSAEVVNESNADKSEIEEAKQHVFAERSHSSGDKKRHSNEKRQRESRPRRKADY